MKNEKNKQKIIKDCYDFRNNNGSVKNTIDLILSHKLVTIQPDLVEEEQKIIGYKAKKHKYIVALKQMAGAENVFSPDIDFQENSTLKHIADGYEVLDLWFEPVYAPKEKTIDEKLMEALIKHYSTPIQTREELIQQIKSIFNK